MDMEKVQFSKIVSPIALVVDDEPLILMDTADLLSDEGYSVIEATTADEAYAFLSTHSSLQLVFTDVQMPGKLNGFDLARKVSERWPHVRVVIASGAAVPTAGDIPSNAVFLQKPLSAALVHETLKDHCTSLKQRLPE